MTEDQQAGTDAHTEGEDDTTEPQNEGDPTPGVGDGEDSDTFPRDYVEKLRQENGKQRQRAARADALGARLHTALVAATGRLADPTDLPYDDAHLDDEEALAAAIDELLERKPHLASRRPRGDVGQGITSVSDSVDLAGILRQNASN